MDPKDIKSTGSTSIGTEPTQPDEGVSASMDSQLPVSTPLNEPPAGTPPSTGGGFARPSTVSPTVPPTTTQVGGTTDMDVEDTTTSSVPPSPEPPLGIPIVEESPLAGQVTEEDEDEEGGSGGLTGAGLT